MRARGSRILALGVGIAALVGVSVTPVLATVPGNDDIGSPIVVDAIPYSNDQDTSDATTGGSDADCAGASHTVWYELTPSEDGRLEANTFTSDYDTTLAVGTPDGGGIDVIACNDDAGPGLQSRVRWDAQAGVTYLFQVGSFGEGPGGHLVFNLLAAPAGGPPSVTLTLDSIGRFDRAGVATISGTVSCTGSDWVYMEVSLRQSVGRFAVSGWGYDERDCSPEPAAWQIGVSSWNGKFAGGKAQVSLFAGTCNDEECDSVAIERQIRLRRR